MLQRVGRDLAGFAGKADELHSTAIEFRRAAFVRRDVRLVMAEHGAPGRREMRKRERIGRGSRRHQENRDLTRKHLGESLLDAPRPDVLPIAQCCALIRPRNSGEDLRGDGGCIVACEVHAPSASLRPRCQRHARLRAAPRPPLARDADHDDIATSRSGLFARCGGNFRATDHFLDRRTLAFMIRIWQGKVGQYCCPSWRPLDLRPVLSSGLHRTVRSGPSRVRGAA